MTTTSPSAPPATDALRTAGTLILLARFIEADLRRDGFGDGLGLPEVGVLGQVDRGVQTPSAVARVLRIDPGRVTRVTDRLVGLGLLAREGDPEDRRRCLLRLTEKGRERVMRARADVSGSMRRVLDTLTPDEYAGLTAGLEAARRFIEEDALAPSRP
jgi:DNA-binding MarR family transcriptional regulator